MSSRLVSLHVLAGAETGTRARIAWTGPSRAPAEAEIRVLLDHVAALSDTT